jgi:LysW-gamma-L-lysine carboxypeptidase
MTIGFRLPPSLTPENVINRISPLEGTIHPYGMESAYTATRDNVLSRALRGAIRHSGGTPRFVHKTGTADMNVVGTEWSCPIVAYGPGDSRLDHTPDEHVDLDEYLRSIEVLSDALSRLQV